MGSLLKRSVKELPGVKQMVNTRNRLQNEIDGLRTEIEQIKRSVKPITPALATVQPHEQELLRRVIEETNGLKGPIIEIGTLLGVTTTRIALWKDARKIVTVDNYGWNPWGLTSDEHRGITHQMLYYLIHTGQVEQVVMDKNLFFKAYKGEAPSLVFLDAIHDYAETKIDIEWAKSVGARVISGHDYCEQFPGVIQAVDEAGGPKELCGSVFRL
jgi:hypothetical protein